MKPSSFQIFDASAGSGKTYALVKEYLKIVIGSPLAEPYKQILALTFTNKAVAEMKQRILNSLIAFSSNTILNSTDPLFLSLCEELDLEPLIVHQRSKKLLDSIIHNYAAFDVSTIDKFNQKLIRTFAYDLKVPLNFEVELDTQEILEKSVDNLIAKAGIEPELTEILVRFALEKIDNDKSWDIGYDFNLIAKLLISENDLFQLRHLHSKPLSYFNDVKLLLKRNISKIETAIINEANRILQFIEECGLEHNDFSGRNGLLPNYFLKLSRSQFNITFDKVWMERIASHPLYPQTNTSEEIKQIIDEIKDTIVASFGSTKTKVNQLKLLNSIYKNITPLSVLSGINVEIELIKQEQNLVLISEFNSIVNDHIKSQPAPFIYERIGEKYKHFFIDEFQDTSIMQWQNLSPLVANALSGERASALIVGDAKQAIYRWRGGKAEQFIALCNSDTIFNVEKELHHLEKNYRSFKSIVNFNNHFFEHVASVVFTQQKYAGLYKSSTQKETLTHEGYVELNFLNIEKEEDKDVLYPSKVLETIDSCIALGFEEKDICILVRYKKEGVAIADYLNAQSDYKIVSSETLLLSRSPEVNFIVDLLRLIVQPREKGHKFRVLSYLVNHKLKIDDEHDFFANMIELDLHKFFNALENHGIYCNYTALSQLPIYEAMEVIIHDFDLVPVSNAYVQYLLDFALDYIDGNRSSLVGFLDHYNDKNEKLSIVFPEGVNAIQIMTIHKAKGLEFPVVIFPYADLDIYKEKNSKVWMPMENDTIEGMEYALINYNNDLKEFGDAGLNLYESHRSELELDNINLLYVCLTRAISHLFIISRKKLNRKGEANSRTYGGLFIHYLKQKGLWADEKLSYRFGEPAKTFVSEDTLKRSKPQKKFLSTPSYKKHVQIVTNASYLWDNTKLKAIERGNLIHIIMELIKTRVDIDFSFQSLLLSGVINTDQVTQLKPVVSAIICHPELSEYYTHDYTIFNERDIILKNGEIKRPDRVVVSGKNEAVIIDYKSGLETTSHIQQMTDYKLALRSQGFEVLKAILVYVNTSIKLKEV